MNVELRRWIMRIKPLHHMAAWMMYNSGWFYFRRVYKRNNYAEVFEKLHNSKCGKRCFIIGNGPSLKAKDLDRLVGEDCFAANHIYMIYPKTSWRPTYYAIADRYMEITSAEIDALGAKIVFLGDYFCRFNDARAKNTVILHQHVPFIEDNIQVSDDISKKIVTAYTVSFHSMQIAAYMGYSEVYLLGFDHNYSFEFSKSGKVIKTDTKESHFFKNTDITVDPRKIVGNMYGMTRAYEAFRDYAKEHGITVKNATCGGKLEVFERVDFDSLFGEEEKI